jgi:hypothetical protein
MSHDKCAASTANPRVDSFRGQQKSLVTDQHSLAVQTSVLKTKNVFFTGSFFVFVATEALAGFGGGGAAFAFSNR